MRKRTQKKRKQFSKKQRKLRLSKKQRKLRLSKKRGQKKMRGGLVIDQNTCATVKKIYNVNYHPGKTQKESQDEYDKRRERLRNAYEGACCIQTDDETLDDRELNDRAICEKLYDKYERDINKTRGIEAKKDSYTGRPRISPASQPGTPPGTPSLIMTSSPAKLNPRPPQRRQPPKPVPNKDCYDRCAKQCSIKFSI